MALSAILAPVIIQNPSMAQQERAWGPGETPAQAADRVMTDEQTVTINGTKKEIKRGEAINFEGGAISLDIGKEAVLQNGTRFLKDGTMVLSNGTAMTADGITILPDGKEEVKESQKADQVQTGGVVNQGQSLADQGQPRAVTGGVKTVVGEGNFIAGLSCAISAPNEVLITSSLISPVAGIRYVFRSLTFGFDRGNPIPAQGVTNQPEAFNEVLRVPERKSAVNVTGTVNGLRAFQGTVTGFEFKI